METSASLREDTYQVVLTKAPTGPVEILLASVLRDGTSVDGQLTIRDGGGAIVTSLDFDEGDWSTPQTIKVTADNEADRETTHFSRITHEIVPATLNNFLGVTITSSPEGTGVADGLGDKVNGDIDSDLGVVVDGSTITISGPAFEAELLAPFQDAALTLAGTPLPGENWIVTINGQPLVYTVLDGDGLIEVASALAGLVNAVSGVDASSGGTEIITVTGTNASEILFSLEFDATGGSDGTADIAGTRASVVVGASSERARCCKGSTHCGVVTQ